MRWVGLTGKMGAGKDRVFRDLNARHPNTIRVSFADQVKRDVRDVLGLDYVFEQPYSELERKLLQWWGTAGREGDPDRWVRPAIATARQLKWIVPVFTDVRFPNEAQAIRDHGGFIVRVNASPETLNARRGNGTATRHVSETALDDWPADLNVPTDLGPQMYESGLSAIEKMAGLMAELW